MELLIGCGNSRTKRIITDNGGPTWNNLVTLDNDDTCNPDVIFDLGDLGYHYRTRAELPWGPDTFDEIHAYEVLEHFGRQGDWHDFLDQFSEFWRILKPGGLFCATVPRHDSEWAWGDPGHTRVITLGSLAFLSQEEYRKQVGVTAMSDYRRHYSADFDLVHTGRQGESIVFVIQAVKPARL
jgi:SAM-dependent methyltransferase